MGNIAGLMVAMVGGITFLLASLAAISQTDAKRLLAWSTIANLGLIVACGGIGTYEAVWAGILLIIFHAVSKSLLFLSVGTVEHNIGSRDIEDMHGMVTKLPEMAVMLTIGIAGMFLAPFGMLISKWAALRAFIDSDNVLIVMALVFGSAATLFYWTKWLGKIVAVLGRSERIENRIKKDEWVSLGIHAIMTVGLCFVFPVISNRVIEPYLEGFYGTQIQSVLSSGNTNLMLMMLGMVLLMPIAMYVYVHLKDDKLVSSYMAGVNRGDNRAFTDSFGKPKEMYLANWYLSKYLDEKALSLFGVAASATTLAVVLMMALGGVL
jgi:ech hydrogenase subunit A